MQKEKQPPKSMNNSKSHQKRKIFLKVKSSCKKPLSFEFKIEDEIEVIFLKKEETWVNYHRTSMAGEKKME